MRPSFAGSKLRRLHAAGRPPGQPYISIIRYAGDNLQRYCVKPSEREPVLLARELHVAAVDAKAQSCPRADGNQHGVALAQIADVETANEVGLALARGEALVQLLAVEQIVDQNEGAGSIGARVEADRRAGPL